VKSDALVVAAWLACLVAFVVLALYVASRDGPGLDLDGVRAVQHAPSAFGDVFDVVNRIGYGSPLTLITAVAMVAFCLRRRPLEAALLLMTAAPRILNGWLKELVEAPRPAPDLVQVRHLVGGFAYPSGHVVGTTVVFVLLFAFAGRLSLGRLPTLAIQGIAVFMVVSVSFARVWAGAHWPSDCVGGYLHAALFLIPLLRLRAGLSRRTKASAAVV
jgi:undecaprenyl-diphosphatase